MGDPLRVSVRMLDGQLIEASLSPRATADDVLRNAATTLDITTDKRLFGLAHIDNNGHFHWLVEDRPLIENAFSLDNGLLRISHNVRYFVDSVFSLEDLASIEMYFLEAHQQLLKDQLDLSYIDYVKLSACLLQVYGGDHNGDSNIGEVLRTLLPFPLRLAAAYGVSEESFEKDTVEQYSEMKGLQRGTAMLRFMQLAERCSRYGTRFYKVVEKGSGDRVLGINARGIYIYTSAQMLEPTKVFHWKFIDNIYFRENKFTIEVRDSRRIVQSSGHLNAFIDASINEDDELAKAVNDPTTQFSLSRRSISAPSVHLYSFICESASLCKTIWSAAINQHQFYLDQRSRRSRNGVSSVDHRELNDRLNRLVSKSSIGSSLPSLSSLHSASSLGMPSAKVADGSTASLPSLKSNMSHKSDEEMQRDRERYSLALKKKMVLWQRYLELKKELRQTCIKEGEITGTLPKEIEVVLDPGEELPKLQKRVGTSFSIPEEFIRAEKGDMVGQMETDVQLHRRIVAAAERLAKDKSMNKSVRKKRQKDFQAAALKLRGLEMGLSQMRLSASKPDVSSLGSNNSANSWAAMASNGGTVLTRAMAQSCPTTPRGSIPDLRHETDGGKSDYEDDEPMPQRAPSSASRRSGHRFSAASSSSSSLGLGLPPSGSSRRSLTQQSIDRSITSDELDNPLLPSNSSPIYENVGYRSTSYRSSYRQAHYPTIQDDQQQHLRKRAVSAHSISRSSPEKSSDTNGFAIPITRTGRPSNGYDKTPSDDDATPTAEQPNPIRRLPTSVSCGAGFTSSLDRRPTNKIRPSAPSTPVEATRRESNAHSRGSSPATHRVTTFPVCHPNNNYDSASALPRFQPPIGRPPLSHFPARGALPHYSQMSHPHLGPLVGSQSSGRLPSQTDPHMEALLDYYKAEARKPQQKTATIV